MEYGPIQLVVLGFDSELLPVGVVDELRRLRETDAIRLIDAIWVSKQDTGDVVELRTSDFSQEEIEQLGELAGALFGFGAADEEGIEAGAEIGLALAETGNFGLDDDDVLEIIDRIPRGASAALLLLEHRWALGLKESVLNNGGSLIAQGFITPQAIIALGEQFADELAAEG